jgi:uncharacterized protein YciI
MLFILQCIDRAGSQALRRRSRTPHLEFVVGHTEAFRFGGPLLGDDGLPLGSLMILDLPDRAALERHMQADPFFSAGLFQTVNVWQTQQVVPEREPGALMRELEATKAQTAKFAAAIPLLRVIGEHAP